MLYLTALQEGLLYGLLALGVYISLRVLDIPDLTTEGSFGFGSALAAVLAAGGHTYLSLPIAFLGGMAARTNHRAAANQAASTPGTGRYHHDERTVLR